MRTQGLEPHSTVLIRSLNEKSLSFKKVIFKINIIFYKGSTPYLILWSYPRFITSDELTVEST